MSRLFAALVFLFGFLPAVASAETLLLMAEEDGCYWCAKWNEEIGPAYPKTIEGKTAPLKLLCWSRMARRWAALKVIPAKTSFGRYLRNY